MKLAPESPSDSNGEDESEKNDQDPTPHIWHMQKPLLAPNFHKLTVTVVICFIFFVSAVTYLALPSLARFHLALVPVEHGKYWHGWEGVEKLFIFGDSYSDVRFDPNSPQPNPSNPIGNPDYPGLTSSNGPNWVDHLVTKYNRSSVGAFDLAFGGSTVSWDIVPSFPFSLDFRHQISDAFVPHYSTEARASWNRNNSLFAIEFGINDVRGSWGMPNNSTINAAIFKVYTNLFDQLYRFGARNFILFNVPPLNLSPSGLAFDSERLAYELSEIKDFNARHSNFSQHMRHIYSDITVFELDLHTLFSRVLKNPRASKATAGVKNTTGYCDAFEFGIKPPDAYDEKCGLRVSQYFWLNQMHPTFVVHEAIAEEVQRVLTAGEKD